MPTIKNPKHERFAQELAKGRTADAAYAEAGYKPDRKNAARLTTNDGIRTRVAEIQERAAIRTEVTIESIAEQLDADRGLAHRVGQAGPAVAASMGKAKLFGLVVDKSNVAATVAVTEFVDRPPRETREEWVARQARQTAERAALRDGPSS